MIKTILLILIVVFLVSCNKEDDLITFELVPLEIGNRWEYNSYQIQGGEEILIGNSIVELDSLFTLNINNEEILTYREITTDGYFTHTRYVNNGKIGFYSYGVYADLNIETVGAIVVDYKGDYLLTYESLIAKYPISSGEKWNMTDIGFRNEITDNGDTLIIRPFEYQIEIMCFDSDVNITADKVSFDCVGYLIGDSENYSKIYYSNGIGRVMTETFENGELIYINRISYFDIK